METAEEQPWTWTDGTAFGKSAAVPSAGTYLPEATREYPAAMKVVPPGDGLAVRAARLVSPVTDTGGQVDHLFDSSRLPLTSGEVHLY